MNNGFKYQNDFDATGLGMKWWSMWRRSISEGVRLSISTVFLQQVSRSVLCHYVHSGTILHGSSLHMVLWELKKEETTIGSPN